MRIPDKGFGSQIVKRMDGSRWYLVKVGGSTRRVRADHLIGALGHKKGSADLVDSFEEGNCSLECQGVLESESHSALETESGVEGIEGPEGLSQFGEGSRSGPVPLNQSSKVSPTSGNENTVAIGSSPAASEIEAGSTPEAASRTLRSSSRIRKPVVWLNL